MNACVNCDKMAEANHSAAQYYDLLVLGKTGMGKSTTTDKLLIPQTPLVDVPVVPKVATVGNQAEQDQKQVGGAVQNGDPPLQGIQPAAVPQSPNEEGQPAAQHPGVDQTQEQNIVTSDSQVKTKTERPKQELSDLEFSMWLVCEEGSDSEADSARMRLKNLDFYRSLNDPHMVINDARKAGMHIYESTKNCELFANEISRMRILDIPGFFGEESTSYSIGAGGKKSTATPTSHSMVKNTVENHLAIMRKIVRIQAVMGMEFRRILYFIPECGPLKRAHATLQQELQLMAHYFGRSIFESMVLVATMPEVVSTLSSDEAKMFPQDQLENTKKYFKQALEHVLRQIEGDNVQPVPDPPIIFISMVASCESIVKKVTSARVARDRLKLKFTPNTCANCSLKICMVGGVKVACALGDNWSNSVPYDESMCHPILIPKYSRLQKCTGGLAHIFTFRWVKNDWPSFADEICHSCNRSPETPGCMRMGEEYEFKGRKIVVAHTNVIPAEDERVQGIQEPQPQRVINDVQHPRDDDELRAVFLSGEQKGT